MARDIGYSAERCRSAISAAEALATTSGETRHWENSARWWRRQLEFAEKRVTP